jgi:hypothetical protein
VGSAGRFGLLGESRFRLLAQLGEDGDRAGIFRHA